MNWWEYSTHYLISLREKGYGDESFYNEFTFICMCINDFKSKSITHFIQEKIFEQEKYNCWI